MPESRKRPGHHEHREPSAIPARQRTKGRTVWAILMAVFAVGIAYFAIGDHYLVLIAAAVVGAAIGYAIGRSMEQAARQ